MTPEPLLLRIEQTARLCNLGRSKTYELVRAGVIPSIRIGRSVRVPAAALEAWISQQVEAQANSEEANSATPAGASRVWADQRVDPSAIATHERGSGDRVSNGSESMESVATRRSPKLSGSRILG